MGSVTAFVVRHAKAGRRSDWDGDDVHRPLSKNGRKQAAALAARLAGEAPTALLASPFARCVQTLEPLGEQLGLAVKADDRLGEGARISDVLALLTETGTGAVLCSHGDVIPDLIEELVRRGMDVHTEPDWRKATVWVLDGDDGLTFTSARVEPPPS